MLSSRQSIWLPGVTRAWPFGRSRQWTLNGAVWDNNYYGKCLALHLMYTLYKNEYTLVSSADVSAKCGQVSCIRSCIPKRRISRERGILPDIVLIFDETIIDMTLGYQRIAFIIGWSLSNEEPVKFLGAL